MGACASGELENKLKPFYLPVGQTELRTAANQAASKRIRHLAGGEWWKLSGRQELGSRRAGQQPAVLLASWPECLLAGLVSLQMTACHLAESHKATLQFRKTRGKQVLFCVISFISHKGLNR